MRPLPSFGMLALAVLAGCATGGPPSAGRYALEREPGSRLATRFVRDRETGRWVQRACELRVATARALPDPLVHPDLGNRLGVDFLRPESIEGAGFSPAAFTVADGYRVWAFREVLRADDVAGRVALGVQVRWPETGRETRFEPLERIGLPPVGPAPPEQWSGWTRATAFRTGGFATVEETAGAAPEAVAPPAHPFELRCRLVLVDNPVLVP